MILPHLRSKAMEPADDGLKTLKLSAKISFSSFSQVFVTATKSLANTPGGVAHTCNLSTQQAEVRGS
jgi:hypothetical protein